MSLIDELKKKADQNGDGRISKEDLDELKGGNDGDNIWLDKLKAQADQNGDGKIGLDDFSGLHDSLGGLKDKFFKK
jgi:Ca2+-binding EF-hand superfamily protein